MKLSLRDTKFIEGLEDFRDELTTGTYIAIDPASKNMGYAIHTAGVLSEAGELRAKGSNIVDRLGQIYRALELFPSADVVSIEQIKFGARTNGRLVWSIGCILTALACPKFIEVPVHFWKKWEDEEYSKTDYNDAIYMGRSVLESL